jgi:PAS domain S-box-containing protein
MAVIADVWYGRLREELLTQSVRSEITTTGVALESSLNARLGILRGVASFLTMHWNRPHLGAEFELYVGALLQDNPGVRTVQYVRDGVIAHTWPLAGNEEAVGRSLRDDPRLLLREDLRRALDSRGITLSGPVELYQGGVGIVSRLAVRSAADTVLGLAAVVVDLAPLLEEARVSRVPGVTVALVDASGTLLAGDSTLLTDPGAAPLRTTVQLPDRQWTILAIPTGGWDATLAARRTPMRLALGVMVLLGSGLAYVLVGRRDARVEVARLRGEEKFARLLSLTPDGVAFTRLSDGALLEVNDSFVQMTGISRAEMLGRTSVELGFWRNQQDRDAMVAALTRDGVLRDYAVALNRRDGAMRETRLSGRVVAIDGQPCVLMIIRDVTEQRKLERRLAEAARMESIGRLAGGVAHDFNNLITAISGYAHLLADRLADRPDDQADATEIVRSSARAADLTAQLLAFARRQVLQPRTVDFNDVILGANRRLRVLLGESVTLNVRLSPEPAFIRIDPTQGDQLLTNLAVNARDAMPQGGTLTIDADLVGDEVVVRFQDSGTGISPEVQAHLFEPFFTTKPLGQGTGLGLATCYGIMEQSGGRIEVASTVGEGATFTLIFPRAPAPHVGAERSAPASALPGGGETILVAEDEAQVRKLTDRVLGGLGYQLLSVGDGAEALEAATTHAGPIHLLLTDMVMPGIGGGELSRRIRERHPEIKVLLMSGYSEELVAAEHGDVPFLPKPFTPGELAAKVREVLDS